MAGKRRQRYDLPYTWDGVFFYIDMKLRPQGVDWYQKMVKETPFGKVIKEGAKETSNVDGTGQYTKRGPKGVQMG